MSLSYNAFQHIPVGTHPGQIKNQLTNDILQQNINNSGIFFYSYARFYFIFWNSFFFFISFTTTRAVERLMASVNDPG